MHGVHEHLGVHHAALLELIRTGKQLSDEVTSGLDAALKEWKEAFEAQYLTAAASA